MEMMMETRWHRNHRRPSSTATGAAGMHPSQQHGTGQSSPVHVTSLSPLACHIPVTPCMSPAIPSEQNLHLHLFHTAKFVPVAAPPRSTHFSHHFCRPWPDSQITVNNCLRALKGKGIMSL